MKSYTNVFFGIVDILGYTNTELRLDSLGKQPAEALLRRIFTFLDRWTKSFHDTYNDIIWNRYGDGYIFYSIDEKIDHLSKMIKNCCMLISMALNQFYPLRIAITQGDIKVDIVDNPPGVTVSGTGWGEIRKLESALDWMGGVLYLPIFNGSHYNTVQKLIQTTFLIKEQNTSRSNKHFKAPFKEGKNINKERTWFLNWDKCLHEPNVNVDQKIKNWWSSLPVNLDNESEEVQRKQTNSIYFADYCRFLYEAANLVYHSGININIDIEEIDNTCI